MDKAIILMIESNFSNYKDFINFFNFFLFVDY